MFISKTLLVAVFAAISVSPLAFAQAAPAANPAEEPKPGLAYELFGDANLQRLAESGSVAEIGPMDKGNSDWGLRFTGLLTPPTDGAYAFRAEAVMGVRLKLDGKLVIDGWAPDGARTGKAMFAKAAPSAIVVEYCFDRSKGGKKAELRLFWTPPGGQEAPVPATAYTHTPPLPPPAPPAKPAAPPVAPPVAPPAATPAPPRPEKSGVTIRVEQPSKTDSDKDKKTVKRSLKVFLTNSSIEPLELKMKYVIFGRGVADKDIRSLAEGDRPASVKPRATEIVETGEVSAVVTESKLDNKRKRIPAAGVRFIGYGVQIFNGDKLVAEAYDPSSLKDSWGKVPAGPAGPAPAPKAKPVKAGKPGGLGL